MLVLYEGHVLPSVLHFAQQTTDRERLGNVSKWSYDGLEICGVVQLHAQQVLDVHQPNGFVE